MSLGDKMPMLNELELARDAVTRRDQRAIKNSGHGATTGGLALSKHYLPALTEQIKTKLAEKVRAGSPDHELQQLLSTLKPELLALVCLQGGLNLSGDNTKLQVHAFVALGADVETECYAQGLLGHDKKAAEKLKASTTKKMGQAKRRRSVARVVAAKAYGFHKEEWPDTLRVYAGTWCCNILTTALPEVFYWLPAKDKEGRPNRRLAITEKAAEFMDEAVEQAIRMRPVWLPRGTKPEDWTGWEMRPSDDPRVAKGVTVIKTYFPEVEAAVRAAIADDTMAPALEGLSLLQAVPFTVNNWVMEQVQKAFDHKLVFKKGMPRPNKLAVPKALTEEEKSKLSIANQILLAKRRQKIIDANSQRTGDISLFKQDMQTARRMAELPQFYTPMTMDFRGRVYPVPKFNFQREDRVRGMFLFKNGAPIGEKGIHWLQVHVANCWGNKVDKTPMDERVQWVKKNLSVLAAYVEAPTVNTGWTKADSPFLFLASCRELVLCNGNPEYVCHLPVSFDGSCSGIQHLAAMTLSPEGAYVNLTNTEQPDDVYERVGVLVREAMQEDLVRPTTEDATEEEKAKDARTKQLAALCLPNVNRSLCKRPCMTFAYSSQVYGMKQQTIKDVMEPYQLEVLDGIIKQHPFAEDEQTQHACAGYFAKVAYRCIKALVKGPAEAMEFLQQLAGALAHEGKPLRWTTPIGLPWFNKYHASVTERISRWLEDGGVTKRIETAVHIGYEARLKGEKCENAVSPNFVHALDASHLVLTAIAAAKEGITDTATVHDSFGCLPCHAERYNEIIRETFVQMYEEHDVLAEIYLSALNDHSGAANKKKLPELPAKGTLDLNEVKQAKYAFA
jgi:DNA-directed RNA polymerase